MATMRYKNDRDQWVVLSFGGAGGDVTSDVIADSYNSERTEENPYNTGDIVMYEGLMYKAQEDGIYGEFDIDKWRQINVDIAIREAGGSGRAEWGYIEGNIEDQEDLQNELNKKLFTGNEFEPSTIINNADTLEGNRAASFLFSDKEQTLTNSQIRQIIENLRLSEFLPEILAQSSMEFLLDEADNILVDEDGNRLI